jgi:hypothetical protein
MSTRGAAGSEVTLYSTSRADVLHHRALSIMMIVIFRSLTAII